MEVMSLCEATHSLPTAGGLLDQDPKWVENMKLWYQVRSEKAKMDDELANRPKGNK